MDSQIIGIKQLYTRMPEITEAALRGQSFTVVKNSQPVFRIEPFNQLQRKAGKYNLHDLAQLRFKSGEKNLSKKIDKIVYGL